MQIGALDIEYMLINYIIYEYGVDFYFFERTLIQEDLFWPKYSLVGWNYLWALNPSTLY